MPAAEQELASHRLPPRRRAFPLDIPCHRRKLLAASFLHYCLQKAEDTLIRMQHVRDIRVQPPIYNEHAEISSVSGHSAFHGPMGCRHVKYPGPSSSNGLNAHYSLRRRQRSCAGASKTFCCTYHGEERKGESDAAQLH